jgi:NAD(P)-dependent dehydrogenase (short-subunit alcohol dehydrogenase family)
MDHIMTAPITPRIDFQSELSRLFRLDGQVVFIPGGYGGIGEAVAWGAAMAGATVVICGRDADKAAALAGALADAGFRADGLAIDRKSVASIRETTDRVARRHGRLDVLINCVGMQFEQPIAEVTEEAFDEVYAVNLKAAMFLGQAAARHQIEGGRGGRQVHLLSVRSTLGIRARGYSAYCSTKGGIAMLIKQHAMELAPHGITVNGVSPTFVYTEMIRHVMENDAFRRGLHERIPLGRIADPKDVVGPVLFFVTPAGGFVTGQNMLVDGGITASQ